MFNREKTHDIRGFDDKKISRFLEMQFFKNDYNSYSTVQC